MPSTLLDPDIASLIVSSMSTTDVLSCAQVSRAHHELCRATLRSSTAIVERGTSVSGAALLKLATEWLDPKLVLRLDVSDCEELTKAQKMEITELLGGLPAQLHSLSIARRSEVLVTCMKTDGMINSAGSKKPLLESGIPPESYLENTPKTQQVQVWTLGS